MNKENVALIDIGSNTIRLVIYGIDDDYNYQELQNIKTPARLSQYLMEEDGRTYMSEEGIESLIEVLKSFTSVARHYHVDRTLPIATAALRLSDNNQEIVERVKQAVGLDIQIISGKEEASYGQYAITHTTTIRDGITIDIGGGSCEITLFKDKQMQESISFPFGVVSLKQDFFEGKAHNDTDAIAKLRKFVRQQFKGIDWIKRAKLDIVAMGGSARNVANVYQRDINYPMAAIHGFFMTEDHLEHTLDLFTQTSLDKMEDIDGLSSDRTDLIIPANLVFLELMDVVKAEYFKVSTQGLREGIILKYINSTYNYPLDAELIRYRTIHQIIKDFPINDWGAQIQVDIVIRLYKQLCDLNLYQYSYEVQEELEYAAYLYRFGHFINDEADSQNTFYLLSNMSLLGFSHYKRLRLALLASYKNRSLFAQFLDDYEGWIDADQADLLIKMGGLLKFSKALNDSQTGPIKHLNLQRLEDGNYQLDIYHHGLAIAEKYRAQRQQKHLERALDKSLALNFIPIQS